MLGEEMALILDAACTFLVQFSQSGSFLSCEQLNAVEEGVIDDIFYRAGITRRN